MAAPKQWRARKQAVFQSVFCGDIAAQKHSAANSAFPSSTPSQFATPQATQPVEAVAPSPSRHGAHPSSSSGGGGCGGALSPAAVLEHQLRWERAWRHVTSAIQLPASVAAEDSFGSLPPPSSSQSFRGIDGGDWHEALAVVLYPQDHVPGAHRASDDNVLLWHTLQVRRHFVHHVLPLLSACDATGDPLQVLLGTVRTLEAAHRQYLWGFTLIARGLDSGAAGAALAKFHRDLHAIVGNSMSDTLIEALALTVGRLVKVILKISDANSKVPPTPHHQDDAPAAHAELMSLLQSLAGVGLAGERFRVMLADMMDLMLDKFVRASYARTWPSPSRATAKPPPAFTQQSKTTTPPTKAASLSSACIPELRQWVEESYGRLIFDMFHRIGGSQAVRADVARWQDLAVGRLAAIRIRELFDIVLHWPDSRQDLQDLKASVTTPQRRLELTDTFSAALHKRLLHPGRSTLEILQVYVSMIQTFHALDPSKVLLDRVVRSLQLYLCQRDDAIRIVVTGLLSDPRPSRTDDGGVVVRDGGEDRDDANGLAELAVLLNDPAQSRRQGPDDEEMDWDDMDWVPDPIDAGVNYKRPKSEDVIGTLINALGAKDVFIKEFQSIMAERLLSPRTDLGQEVRVLNLLKRRFGENALQNCDVMLRDIDNSRKLDAAITRSMAASAAGHPAHHAKIVSRLFWPAMERDFFVVPPPVAAIQREYSRGFERAKAARKLAWIDGLGSATVRLDLEDRPFECRCKTYEAAVIYAFGGEDEQDKQDEEDTSGKQPAQRTVDELEEALMLDRDLLVDALRFWVKQGILRQATPDTYVVIESVQDEATRQEQGTLAASTAPASASASHGGAEPSSSAKKTHDGVGRHRNAPEEERRQIYWQFVVGMLTNSMPAMPLANMAMMMGMLIPGGFKWGNEELRDFLGEKVAEGELEFAGGKYRLPKK